MSQTSGNRVLYHAVSSYQLLEVLLHRKLYHGGDQADLLLPDFIVEKYPQWQELERRGFFDRVRLFPYLQIPHRGEEQVVSDTERAYGSLGFPRVEEYGRIYMAGAHFYFSLYLIHRQVPFCLMEDAAGILSRPERGAQVLARKFPSQAALAEKYGLFTGNHPLISQVICCVQAQAPGKDLPQKVQDFSVEKALEALTPWDRHGVVKLFVPRKIWTRAQVILLTQQFSGLGLMDREDQLALYGALARGPLGQVPLLIKKHPDDRLEYGTVFPRAKILRQVFPAELLPYVFWRRPPKVCAFSSASLANLKDHFQVEVLPEIQQVWRGEEGRKRYGG